MPGMLARLRSAFRAFVAPVLATGAASAPSSSPSSLIPMVGAVGLAVDSSLGYLLKARMSKSLDAAGLAAGRKALDDDAEEVARAYFDANFGEDLGDIELTDFDFELDDEQRHVTLSAEATTPTYFMRVFGHDEMTVSARTVIERQTTGMELALVMDNTGSMWASDTKTNIAGTPFEAMQNAALDLIDIIYGEEEELDNVWVSLVPFVAAVNIGTAPDRLARGRRPGLHQPGELPARPDRRRLEGLRDGPRLSVRHRRRDARDAAVHLVLLRDDHDRQQLADAINDAYTGHQRGAKGTEPRLRHADHAADPVARDGRGRDRRDEAVAARRHHRQPRAGLGLAHDLAELARALGRRRPAARLRHRLHGQGRRDADRRQQRVLRPSRHRAATRRSPRTSPPTAASTRRVRSG